MKLYTVNYLYFFSKEDNLPNVTQDEVDGYCIGVYTSDSEAEKAVRQQQSDDVNFFDDCHFTLTELLGGYKMNKGKSFIHCWLEQTELKEMA